MLAEAPAPPRTPFVWIFRDLINAATPAGTKPNAILIIADDEHASNMLDARQLASPRSGGRLFIRSDIASTPSPTDT
jgi:hypothetical protein